MPCLSEVASRDQKEGVGENVAAGSGGFADAIRELYSGLIADRCECISPGMGG